MSYFTWGTIILFSATAVFYAVFASLVYYWHEKKTTTVIVPVLYTFEFFLISFLVIFIATALLEFFPEISIWLKSIKP